MHHHRLGDLAANIQHWVQAGHRFLENHRDRAAPDFADLRFRHLHEVPAFEQYAPGADPPIGPRQKAQDGQRRQAFAATRLAHNAQGLAAVYLEGEVVDRDGRWTIAGREFRAQPLDAQDGIGGHQILRARRGSSMSRSPSPRMLMDSTITARKMLGNKMFQKAICT